MKRETWRKRWIQLLGIVLCILVAIIAGYIADTILRQLLDCLGNAEFAIQRDVLHPASGNRRCMQRNPASPK